MSFALRFVPVAPARHAGSRAHTSCLPTRYCVGAFCVRLGACLVGACCGRVCLRVVGLRFFVFAWVFAWVVCACLGVVGGVVPLPPLFLPRFACLRVYALVWALLACATLRLCVGVVAVMGRDMVVPPHAVWRALSGCYVARKRGVRVLTLGVLTRAHISGERRGWWEIGPPAGLCGLAGGGLCVRARWVVTRIGGDKYPKPRESKIDTAGAGAGCASRPWW